MAAEDYTHKKSGNKFTIEAVPLRNGKRACVITPENGRPVFLAEPHATERHGPLVEFETDDEAIGSGKEYVDSEFLRD